MKWNITHDLKRKSRFPNTWDLNYRQWFSVIMENKRNLSNIYNHETKYRVESGYQAHISFLIHYVYSSGQNKVYAA